MQVGRYRVTVFLCLDLERGPVQHLCFHYITHECSEDTE